MAIVPAGSLTCDIVPTGCRVSYCDIALSDGQERANTGQSGCKMDLQKGHI